MPKDLKIVQPLTIRLDARLDGRVGSNTNINHYNKGKLVDEIKGIIKTNVIGQINLLDLWPMINTLLEEKNMPLVVLCTRYYGGKSMQMDEDNLASCFKPWVDGLCLAIGFTKTKNTKNGPVAIARDDPKSLKMRHFQVKFPKENSLEFIVMPYYQYVAGQVADESLEKDNEKYNPIIKEFCDKHPEMVYDRSRLNEEFYKVKLSLLRRQICDLTGNIYNSTIQGKDLAREQYRFNTLVDNYRELLKEALLEPAKEPEQAAFDLEVAHV